MVSIPSLLKFVLGAALTHTVWVNALPSNQLPVRGSVSSHETTPLAIHARDGPAIDLDRHAAPPNQSERSAGETSTNDGDAKKVHRLAPRHRSSQSPASPLAVNPNFPPGRVIKNATHTHMFMTALEAMKGGRIIASGTGLGLEKEKASEPKTPFVPPPAPAAHTESKAMRMLKRVFYDLPLVDACYRFPLEVDADFLNEQGVNYHVQEGAWHTVSEAMCPPGTIGHTYSYSTTFSVNGNLGPDLKGLLSSASTLGSKLDKFALRLGFSYSWTTTQSTTYTASETTATQGHPFVLYYRPRILVVAGDVQVTRFIRQAGEKIYCPPAIPATWLQFHLPAHADDGCESKKTACGPSAVWDHCFFVGKQARELCPNRNLGPTPEKGRCCPTSFYDKDNVNSWGQILP